MATEQREAWTHSPRGMMEYFQAAKHTFGESIADLVDNGLDAGADRIEIDVSQFGDDQVPYIAIFDNGDGMDVEALSNAMSLAKRQEDRPDTDLGLFGIGMKISSLAQADEVTILSKPKHGSSIAIRRISAPFVKDNDANEILRFPTGSGGSMRKGGPRLWFWRDCTRWSGASEGRGATSETHSARS